MQTVGTWKTFYVLIFIVNFVKKNECDLFLCGRVSHLLNDYWHSHGKLKCIVNEDGIEQSKRNFGYVLMNGKLLKWRHLSLTN